MGSPGYSSGSYATARPQCIPRHVVSRLLRARGRRRRGADQSARRCWIGRDGCPNASCCVPSRPSGLCSMDRGSRNWQHFARTDCASHGQGPRIACEHHVPLCWCGRRCAPYESGWSVAIFTKLVGLWSQVKVFRRCGTGSFSTTYAERALWRGADATNFSPRGCVGENCKWTANGRGWTRWDHGRLALSGATSADSGRDIRQRNVTPPDALTRPHNPKVRGSNPFPATRPLMSFVGLIRGPSHS